MGSQSTPRLNAERANGPQEQRDAVERSSEQSIASGPSSITFLSDEALVTAVPQKDETTWERLLTEVARAPNSAEIRQGEQGNESLAEGDAVGEYRIVKQLGRGTFGTVYQAVQPVIGKEVAVKIVNARFAADAHVVRRFIEEARAVNRIRHPNIVDVFGFGELPDGRKFFVMELLDGETLGALLEREGAISPGRALPILSDVASALDATHARGILHRDLSPGNVFLVKDGLGRINAKLLDFGVAKMLNEGNGLGTQTGALIGTPAYMSPEQCKGAVLDATSDIYSLGIIAHELLTGQRPFSGSSVEHFVTKHIYAPPPRVSECNGNLPVALDKPILRMLAKKPSERPASASAAVDAIAEVWNGLSEAQRSGRRGGGLRFVKALLLVGLIASSAAAYVAYRSHQQHSTAQQTVSKTNVIPVNEVPAQPPATPSAAAVVDAPMPTEAPKTEANADQIATVVSITLKGLPPGTMVYDGKRQLGRARDGLLLPKGATPLVLTLAARGYRLEKLTVVPDRDQELTPVMTKTSPGARPSGSKVLGELEY